MIVKTLWNVCIRFVLTCSVCVIVFFSHTALAEDSKEAWVWNSESYRVMLYETPDLTTSSIYYRPYLLNGFPVRVQEWSDNGASVCISFLEYTFWISSEHVSMLPPEDMGYHIFRTVTEDISLLSQNEEMIPIGTQVDVRGYMYDTVIIDYNGEIFRIDPGCIQLREITYDAPEYLLSQVEVIVLCKNYLVEVYELEVSDVESMRVEFVSYSTLSAPALYIVRLYATDGAIYTLHCDGEYGVVIDSHVSPYAVG